MTGFRSFNKGACTSNKSDGSILFETCVHDDFGRRL